MTQEEYKQRLEVALAMSEGKQCEAQWLLGVTYPRWKQISILDTLDHYPIKTIFDCSYEVRIKSTPKLVPWDSINDVPLDHWFRQNGADEVACNITRFDPMCAAVFMAGVWYKIKDFQDKQHSPDGRTNWHACIKEVT